TLWRLRDVPVPVLLVGLESSEQEDRAYYLSSLFLCLSPEGGSACGQCVACRFLSRQLSPDLLWLKPAGKSEFIRGFRLTPFMDKPEDVEEEEKHPSVLDFVRVPPTHSRLKVVVLERVERVRPEACNVLLKALEESPSFVRYILTTTHLSSVRRTIRSRCLLVPCGFGGEGEDSPVGRLAGGSLRVAQALRDSGLEEWAVRLDRWLEALPGRPWESALKVSEEFQDFCEEYVQAMQKSSRLGARGLRCEFLRLFAQWLGSALRKGEMGYLPYLQGALDMHRAVQQNVHFGYVSDAYFCGVLFKRRGAGFKGGDFGV
ncbi:MAG: hypothetical protein K6T17_03625, partial [Fimbriimonadales bacterium]|nr:hypothetical protein [Fimbriimonadales bacterium]